MATERNGLTGQDIRGGIELADDVMHDVQKDIRQLAKETRWEAISGNDRKEFFKGLTQEEYDTLHAVATAMGPKGENKLEMILREALEYGEN